MFDSSIQAVRASLQIQDVAKENDINLRIGIHIGDVIIKDKDIIGSGVNIASRIEPLAPTGSICISEDVWYQIRNQEGLYAASLGKQKLKNVRRLIEIFKLVPDEVTLKAERISFLQNLWQRRVPQILVLYLVACWVIVEIVSSLLVDRYLLSTHLIDFSIVTLLSLIPSILLLAYFHGKPGRDEWTKGEKKTLKFRYNKIISNLIKNLEIGETEMKYQNAKHKIQINNNYQNDKFKTIRNTGRFVILNFLFGIYLFFGICSL
ncbi:MAG: adenylate/guanylate cyclase domain-containing protein [Candidatus Cloacimonetes bacterium]|nr:adenylate/guanylate cyclase domain-containing protein [Candidatus Cloacimonadota bacterium]